MSYVSGDFWRICDSCGWKVRASQTRKRWDGLMVCRADFEERHPQDFVKLRPERVGVPDARPEPSATYIGALSTTLSADAAAGATSLTVTASTSMVAGDSIGVTLDSGAIQANSISSVTDGTHIVVTTALAGPATSGNLITDYTRTTGPSYT